MTLPTGWSSLDSFTTIFGTKINGSEITWYNDATSTAEAGTELKFHWKQNLFSAMYTWYDSADLEDAQFFLGHYDYNALTGATAYVADDDTSATIIPSYFTGDILFYMQIANPVTSATPAYDGFWHLAKTSIDMDAALKPLTTIHDHITTSPALEPVDLVPASDGGLELDSANGDCTGDTSQWSYDNTETQLCLTEWTIGITGRACVQVEAYFKRPLLAETT